MHQKDAPRIEMATADYLPQVDTMCHHFPSGHVVYLFHALGKGYFRDEGILPVFARTNHSPKVIEALAANICPVGTATAASVILATAAYAEKGGDPAKYPVKIVYQADQNYSAAYYSLSNEYRASLGLPLYPKNITTPQDLVGLPACAVRADVRLRLLGGWRRCDCAQPSRLVRHRRAVPRGGDRSNHDAGRR